MSWLSKAIKGVSKAVGGVVKKVASPVINTLANIVPGGNLIKTGISTVVGLVKKEKENNPAAAQSSTLEVLQQLVAERVDATLQAAKTQTAAQGNINEVSEFVNANKWVLPMMLGGGVLIYLVARRR